MQFFEIPDWDRQSPIYKHMKGSAPRAIGFSPDGRFLAVWNHGRVLMIDTASGTVRTLWSEGQIGGSSVPGVGFTADGRGVIAHHDRHPQATVEVHDVDTGAVIRPCPIEHSCACEPGPAGRFVYLSVHPKPGLIEIVRWNPLTGDREPAFGRHQGHLRQVAVSADESWVAASSTQLVRLWNLRGKKLPTRAARQFRLDEHSWRCITGLALSSDGAYLAATSPTVTLWNARTGERSDLTSNRGSGAADFCRNMTFHPIRPILAYSGRNNEVTFFDAAAGREITRFDWEIGPISALAFTSDGFRCAAASTGKAVIWDVD